MARLSRRTFVFGAAAGVATACTSLTRTTGATSTTAPAEPASGGSTSVAVPTAGLRADPFTCGVASGDPLADRVVLWTRATAPPGTSAVPLAWEIANDDAFTTIAASGRVDAPADDDYTVRVDASGLQSNTRYWYRFRVDGYEVRGRTRTAPAPGAAVDRLAFGFGSCQNFENGYYAAHRDVAGSDLDLFVWLGDYIYEYARTPGALREHTGEVCRTLADYRARYALYRSDADLRAAHASCPWVVVWDDHEVENDYAADLSADPAVASDAFLKRRAQAYRAWWEYMPTRLPRPDGATLRIYRDVTWGALAHLHLLDGRQYRSDQACNDAFLSNEPPCADWSRADRTMLGAEQETWLLDGLRASNAAWHVIGNQVVMADARLNGAVLNYDMWDGYPAARARLLRGMAEAGGRDIVVVTGDIHLGAVADLRLEDGKTVATELVGTSISSGAIVPASLEGALGLFPALKYLNVRKRGWVRNVVTPERWTAEYRAVADVNARDAAVVTDATFAIARGTPGAVRV